LFVGDAARSILALSLTDCCLQRRLHVLAVQRIASSLRAMDARNR
jgi:hypothetical protein